MRITALFSDARRPALSIQRSCIAEADSQGFPGASRPRGVWTGSPLTSQQRVPAQHCPQMGPAGYFSVVGGCPRAPGWSAVPLPGLHTLNVNRTLPQNCDNLKRPHGLPKVAQWVRICLQCRRHRLDLRVWKIPWRGNGYPPSNRAWRTPWPEEPGRLHTVRGVAESQTPLCRHCQMSARGGRGERTDWEDSPRSPHTPEKPLF